MFCVCILGIAKDIYVQNSVVMRYNLLLCPGNLVLKSMYFFLFIFFFFKYFWVLLFFLFTQSILFTCSLNCFYDEQIIDWSKTAFCGGNFFLLVLYAPEFAEGRKVSTVRLFKFLEGRYLVLYQNAAVKINNEVIYLGN